MVNTEAGQRELHAHTGGSCPDRTKVTAGAGGSALQMQHIVFGRNLETGRGNNGWNLLLEGIYHMDSRQQELPRGKEPLAAGVFNSTPRSWNSNVALKFLKAGHAQAKVL